MKKWLALFVAIGILGCEAKTTAPATTDTVPPTPAPTVAPSESKPSDVKPAVGQKAPSTNTDARTGNYPSRINQLKDLATATLHANGHAIKVWIMDTVSKRQEGMMFLYDKDVHDDEGMIFLFAQEEGNDKGFWMKNCPMGLDICYIDKSKHVINIADGKPEDENPVYPQAPYYYVLEMRTNCAKKMGIKKGTVVDIPASLKAADTGD